MGYIEFVEMKYGINGNLEEKDSFLELMARGMHETSGEIVGDANANGTLIYARQVNVGELLIIDNVEINNKIATCTFRICQSDIGAVGGVEIQLKEIDIVGAGLLSIAYDGKPLLFINNLNGLAPVFLLIYAPQARAGVATNNAITQYWSANVSGKLVVN